MKGIIIAVVASEAKQSHFLGIAAAFGLAKTRTKNEG